MRRKEIGLRSTQDYFEESDREESWQEGTPLDESLLESGVGGRKGPVYARGKGGPRSLSNTVDAKSMEFKIGGTTLSRRGSLETGRGMLPLGIVESGTHLI